MKTRGINRCDPTSNRVLFAIRKVNQLIVREKDPERLIHETCKLLVEHLSYGGVMIILTGAAGEPWRVAQTGWREAFHSLAECLKRDLLPPCCQGAWQHEGLHRITDRAGVCSSCPMLADCAATDTLCLRLWHGDTTYGCLVISVEHVRRVDVDEQSLLTELAGDLAFALHEMEMEDARRLTEAALRKAHDELEQRLNERSEQLHAAKQAAESANRAKSEFLSAMSHELRSPLGAIIGFSELLQEKLFGDLNPKQEEYVRDIVESGRHLLALINDILDLSKVESDSVDLSTFALEGMLDNSLAMIREKCHKHGIRQNLEVFSELQGTLLTADERKFKQVMFNLLSNAAKFTPDGGTITVAAKRDGTEVIVSVADTGIGIAEDDQQKIFDEFYQVEKDAKGKTPGTGLGLPLVRRLVELHGGRLWVESEGEGKGSTFHFTIPVQAGQVEPAGTRDAVLDAAEKDVTPRSAVMRRVSDCVDRYRVGLGRFCFCRMDPVERTVSVCQDTVVQELNMGKRENDTVLVDEDGNFVLILTNTYRAGAEVGCRRLAARLQERLGVEWQWAVAVCPDDGQTAESLLEVLRVRAEKAHHTGPQEHQDGIR